MEEDGVVALGVFVTDFISQIGGDTFGELALKTDRFEPRVVHASCSSCEAIVYDRSKASLRSSRLTRRKMGGCVRRGRRPRVYNGRWPDDALKTVMRGVDKEDKVAAL